jgi:hypothetical protein
MNMKLNWWQIYRSVIFMFIVNEQWVVELEGSSTSPALAIKLN